MKLDTTKLLGFRLIRAEVLSQAAGAKIGEGKGNPPTQAMGAKIGSGKSCSITAQVSGKY